MSHIDDMEDDVVDDVDGDVDVSGDVANDMAADMAMMWFGDDMYIDMANDVADNVTTTAYLWTGPIQSWALRWAKFSNTQPK
jgi:hypothetical protein